MTVLQQLYNALAVSAIYLAVALGITLTYGLTRTVNFAQGQILVLGAFMAYTFVSVGVPVLGAIALSAVAIALLGVLLDLALFRRALNNPLNGFVISLGLIVVIQAASVLLWSPNQYIVDAPFTGVSQVFGIRLDHPRLFIILVTAVVLVLLFLFLGRSKTGRGLRALSEDRSSALLMGVPVGRYISIAFLIGSGIAGLAGGLLATAYPFDAYFGSDFILIGFAIAIVGGLGSAKGAALAALVLTIPQTFGAAYVSLSWAPAFGLAATALIILWRPAGLIRSSSSDGGGHFTLGGFTQRLHAAEVRLHAGVARLRPSAAALVRRHVPTRAGLAAVWIVLALVPAMATSARTLSTATYGLIMSMAAFAFWFVFRKAGLFPIASAAMMATGGYVAAVTLQRWELNFWLALPAAVLVSALVALMMALVTLRSSASHFAILTLVLSELIVLTIANWRSLTNGMLGMTATTFPSPLGGIEFDSSESFYYLCFGLLVVTAVVLWLVVRSAFGRKLDAVRENADLARSVGIDVEKAKTIAFTVFGGISGAAGVLLFYYLQYIDPTTFSVFTSINVQLIVLLGGIAVWSGPVIGATIFAFVPTMFGLGPDQAPLVYGLVLIFVMVFVPGGIGGLIRYWYVLLASHWMTHTTGDDNTTTRNRGGTETLAASGQTPRSG